MNIDKNIKKAGAILGVVTIVLVGIYGGFCLGCFYRTKETPDPIDPEPYYPTDHLSIDASFLLKTDETNESVNVSCDLFMTNIWEKESGEIKATAYVSEKNTNLAVYKNTVEFGVIEANSTKELNIPVKFSDDSYQVKILLFENNKLFKKVTLSITIYQNYYIGSSGGIVYNEGRTKEHASRDGQWSIESGNPEIVEIH